MEKKNKIEEEIQMTLEQFEKKQDLKPDPYFYSKVITRIESAESERRSFNRYLSPAFILLIILLNAVSISFYLGENSRSDNLTAKQTLINVLQNDFNSANNLNQSIF